LLLSTPSSEYWTKKLHAAPVIDGADLAAVQRQEPRTTLDLEWLRRTGGDPKAASSRQAPPPLIKIANPMIKVCCRPKPPDRRRRATREPGGPEPLSVGPAAHTRPKVGIRWACHLTYT
jgi:hypothetical protein